MNRLIIKNGKKIVVPLTQEEIQDSQRRTAEEQQRKLTEEQEREDNFTFDGVMLVIAKAFLNHENRLRALENKPEVTLKQLIKALRQL